MTSRTRGSTGAPRARLVPGERFDRYVLLDLLGRGGMGEVWRATDPKLDRQIALKVLDDASGATSTEARRRVLREARAAAALNHPNVVGVHDVGEVEGTPYITMELVDGVTLREYVGDARVSVRRRAQWALDIARALAAAHARGIIHRDVKPENVIVRRDGVLKVLDFGIAARVRVDASDLAGQASSATTSQGELLGTLMYMAPEQLLGAPVDARADQFAWGVLAVELLAGAHPWNAKAPLPEVVQSILHGVVAPLQSSDELAPEVSAAIARALCKDPEARFASMRALLDAVGAGESLPSLRGARAASPAASTVKTPGENPERGPFATGDVLAERYEIVRTLGRGAMGDVYEAIDRETLARVALKSVRADRMGDAKVVERFRREADLARRVNHPNVVRVLDVREHASADTGRPTLLIAMELLHGESLAARIRSGGALSTSDAFWIVSDICAALEAAHAAGIVHRDLTSANVFLVDGGARERAVVTDFGLARAMTDDGKAGLSRDLLLLGTPAYLAPEQIGGGGGDVDARADIYSLGVVMFEMVTGRLPFVAPTSVEMAMQRLSSPPPSPRSIVASIDDDWESTVLRCLSREKDDRFETVRGVVAALRSSSVTPGVRKRGWARRGANVLAAIAVMAGVAQYVAHARADAADRERAAGELGGSAATLDGIIRRAYLLPLHDTRPDREAIAAQMRRIEDDMTRVPSAAAAGKYAVGHAYLALHDPARAREWLERAVAAGPPDASVELALGEAMGQLYRRAVSEARRVPAALREPKLVEATNTFRDPALAHLRAARSLGASPERAEGLVALYEQRFDDAIRSAAAAAARDALAYDAKELEADAEYAAAGFLYTSGKYADADAAYTRAGNRYAAAIAIARSDGELYEKDARRHAWQMEVAIALTRSPLEAYAGANARIDDALVVDADSAQALLARAEASTHFANWQSTHGQDPLAAYDVADRSARRASALTPADANARRILGDALESRGTHEMSHGIDPTASFQGAIDELEPWADRGEGDAWVWHVIAISRDRLATYRNEQGLLPDPRVEYQAAAEAYERAIERNPNWSSPLINLCNMLRVQSELEWKLGIDPLPTLDRAAAAADAAMRAEPGGAAPANNRGLVELRRAEATLRRGGDASGYFASALSFLGDARKKSPGYAMPIQNVGNVRLAMAVDDRMHGRDPTASLDEAKRAFAARLAIDPKAAWAKRQTAEAWRIAANDAFAHGLDPRAPLAEAARALADALALKSDDNDVRAAAAEIALLEARAERARHDPRAAASIADARAKVDALFARDPRHLDGITVLAFIEAERAAQSFATGVDPGESIASGLAACDRADAIVPGFARVACARGALLLQSALTRPDVTERRRGAAAALAAFDPALAADATLTPDFGGLRDLARRASTE